MEKSASSILMQWEGAGGFQGGMRLGPVYTKRISLATQTGRDWARFEGKTKIEVWRLINYLGKSCWCFGFLWG